MANIYLVRHGETEENRTGIVQGQLDTLLNDVGVEQSKLVAGALQKVPFDIAYSSDLSRATQTAEAILAYHPDVPLEKQEELRERFLGEFQGKRAEDVWDSSLEDSMETKAHFACRAVTWWNRTILQPQSSLPAGRAPRHILVTTHGGFIGILLRTLIGSRKATCAEGVVIGKALNSSVTIIKIENGKGTVLQYGDVSHLVDKACEEGADEIGTGAKR